MPAFLALSMRPRTSLGTKSRSGTAISFINRLSRERESS